MLTLSTLPHRSHPRWLRRLSSPQPSRFGTIRRNTLVLLPWTTATTMMIMAIMVAVGPGRSIAWTPHAPMTRRRQNWGCRMMDGNNNNNNNNENVVTSSFDNNSNSNNNDSNDWTALSNGGGVVEDDWQKVLLQKQDGSFWSSFEPSMDDDMMDGSKSEATTTTASNDVMDDDQIAEMWIDQIQALASKEVEFNMQEADRADKVRQMEEYGFDREIIQNALGVAMDTTLETINDVQGMQMYREESFWDNVDLTTVESHSRVEKDTETLEPTRLQMVYVDEHTCIGCTNCAMIAQSTFFMHPEHGRARVFQQWGDTDETIQIAIETCPVDCIHYVPYDELVALEIDRRDQNINFKARLVSQAENGNTMSHLSGRGSNAYTAPQQISGNMKSRCNNCPSRGCRTCPMYGVGKNPAFEAAEQLRKEKAKKRQVQAQRERDEKSIEL